MALSFDEFRRKKAQQGVAPAAPTVQGEPVGMASGTPTTPVDTGMNSKQPRLTFAEWRAQKQQAAAPQVSPSTVEAVQKAPQPAPAQAPEVPEETQQAPAEPAQAPIQLAQGVTGSITDVAKELFPDSPVAAKIATAIQNAVDSPVEAISAVAAGGLAGTMEAARQVPGATSVMKGLMPGVGPLVDMAMPEAQGEATGMEAIQQAASAGAKFGREEVAPIIREEALPTIGAMVATTVLPGSGAPVLAAKAAKWAPKVTKLASKVITGAQAKLANTAPLVYGTVQKVVMPSVAVAARASAGAGTGEAIEQTLKDQGYIMEAQGDQGATTGERALRVADRAAAEAMWSLGTAAALNLIGPAYQAARSFSIGKNPNKQALDEVIAEYGMPKTVGDVNDGILGQIHKAISKNSIFGSAGFTRTKEAQREAMGGLVKDMQTKVAKAGGLDDMLEGFSNGMMNQLPSNVLADHITMALTKGERVRNDLIGAGYDALDELMVAGGMVKQGPVQSLQHMIGPDGNIQYIYKDAVGDLPSMGVDMTPVKKSINDLIAKESEGLQAGAKADFTQFAKAQLRVLQMDDEITFGAARRHISRMKSELRDMQATNQSQKAFFLQKAIGDMTEAVESAGSRMASEGITVPTPNGPMDPHEYLKMLNGMWSESKELFGNKYVRAFLNKADTVEGDASALADSFLKSRESANALMGAIEAGEAAAKVKLLSPTVSGTPDIAGAAYLKAGDLTNGGAQTIIDLFPKLGRVIKDGETALDVLKETAPTRAAIASKVMERQFGRVLKGGQSAQDAIAEFGNPEVRATYARLMGVETLDQMERYSRAMLQLSRDIPLDTVAQSAMETTARTMAARIGTTTAATLADVHLAPFILIGKALNKPSEAIMGLMDEIGPATVQQRAQMTQMLMRRGAEVWMEEYAQASPEEQERLRLKAQFEALANQ